MQQAKISCTSSYVPQRIVTNDELATLMDTSDEWIDSRTGIKQRHVVTEETTFDLCYQVAKQLLEKSGKTPEDLDFILVATMTPDYQTPSVACLVQGALQAKQAFAFDLNSACSGFVYALSMGEKLIRTGQQCGLVIGGETLSKLVDWEDRATAVLFGDASAGVLLEATDKQHFLAEKLQADGERGQALRAGYIANESPFFEETIDDARFLRMNGRAIYDFSLKDVIANVQMVSSQTDTVDYFLLHQANKRIIEKIAKKTKIPFEKFLTNMERHGNTSAASVPLLLDQAVTSGQLTLGSGQKIVLTGYGGGLTWGSILVTL